MKRKSETDHQKYEWPRWGTRFVEKLHKTRSFLKASKSVGIDYTTAHRWRDRCPKFAAACEEARHTFVEELEASMWTRAIKGWLEPVYQNGKKVGERRRYSDTLQIFMAKCHKPERYGPKFEDMIDDPERMAQQILAYVQGARHQFRKAVKENKEKEKNGKAKSKATQGNVKP